MWTVTVRAARPAIIAGAVLAIARAIGEAIMLSMVSGSEGFAPNPPDGVTFIFEPLRTLAATIVEDAESINAPAMQASLYAMASCCWSAVRALDRQLDRQAAPEEVLGEGVAPWHHRDAARRRSAAAAPSNGAARRSGERVDLDLALERPRRLRADVDRRPDVVAIGFAIVLYMAFRGAQYLRPSLIFSHPQAGLDQSKSGGFLDPLLGTVLLTLDRHHDRDAARRRRGDLDRRVRPARVAGADRRSGIEIIAGTPDIVIALFGLLCSSSRASSAGCRSPPRTARSSGARS